MHPSIVMKTNLANCDIFYTPKIEKNIRRFNVLDNDIHETVRDKENRDQFTHSNDRFKIFENVEACFCFIFTKHEILFAVQKLEFTKKSVESS